MSTFARRRSTSSLALLAGLLVGLPVAAGGATKAARPAHGPVHVRPFAAPEDLAPLGAELAREVGAELGATAGPGEKTDAAIEGKLEPLPAPGGLRLRLSCHGTTVTSDGDLEHLPALVHDAVDQLRPHLGQAEEGAHPGKPVKKAVAAAVPRRPQEAAPVPPPAEAPAPAPTPPPPTPAAGEGSSGSAPTSTSTSTPTAEVSAPAPPPLPLPSTSGSSLPLPGAPPGQPPLTGVPRVAVLIVGEPAGQVPPALVGSGPAAQRAAVTYLDQRLRVRAVPVRLVGPVPGDEAAAEAERARARYVLMARFEGMDLYPARLYQAPALSGRVYVVLLRDGKARVERTVTLPLLPVSFSETPANLAGRAMAAALDRLYPELRARLSEP